jgi:hypothetical protein
MHPKRLVEIVIGEHVCRDQHIPITEMTGEHLKKILNNVKHPIMIDCIFDVIFDDLGRKKYRSNINCWIRKPLTIEYLYIF